MDFQVLQYFTVLIAVPAAFMLSSAAGLGGSLILVPALMMILGVKEGVALAALLLATNNLAKLWAYRTHLPVKESLTITLMVIAGSALGASLMVQAPAEWVNVAVFVALVATFAADFLPHNLFHKAWSGCLAFFSGATSGFSGTSGPLKGIAIKNLKLERQFVVGAASIVSLAGDATKAIVFSNSGLLSTTALLSAALLIPVMIICTLLGKKINQSVGEKGYALLFWGVMAAYAARLAFSS